MSDGREMKARTQVDSNSGMIQDYNCVDSDTPQARTPAAVCESEQLTGPAAQRAWLGKGTMSSDPVAEQPATPGQSSIAAAEPTSARLALSNVAAAERVQGRLW